MPKHVLLGSKEASCDCHKNPSRLSCNICDGGLSLCTVCGGAEGSLPTDCPGSRMSAELSESVYAGLADYRDGLGWLLAPQISMRRFPPEIVGKVPCPRRPECGAYITPGDGRPYTTCAQVGCPATANEMPDAAP